MFPDPFRGGDNLCVLCEGFKWADTTYTTKVPVNTNFRSAAVAIFDSAKGEEPWYGIEQEYTLLKTQNRFTTHPYGWPNAGYPGA
jgi:glutamine synthetase